MFVAGSSLAPEGAFDAFVASLRRVRSTRSWLASGGCVRRVRGWQRQGGVSPSGTALARRALRSLAHVPDVRCCWGPVHVPQSCRKEIPHPGAAETLVVAWSFEPKGWEFGADAASRCRSARLGPLQLAKPSSASSAHINAATFLAGTLTPHWRVHSQLLPLPRAQRSAGRPRSERRLSSHHAPTMRQHFAHEH